MFSVAFDTYSELRRPLSWYGKSHQQLPNHPQCWFVLKLRRSIYLTAVQPCLECCPSYGHHTPNRLIGVMQMFFFAFYETCLLLNILWCLVMLDTKHEIPHCIYLSLKRSCTPSFLLMLALNNPTDLLLRTTWLSFSTSLPYIKLGIEK